MKALVTSIVFFLCFSLAGQLTWESMNAVNKLTEDIPKQFFGEFKFKNTSDKQVTIDSIKTWCGCAKITLDKYTYQPGESGTIPYKVNLIGRDTDFTKNIKILIRNGKAQNLKFTMEFPENFEVVKPEPIAVTRQKIPNYEYTRKTVKGDATPVVPPSVVRSLKRQTTCPFQQKPIKRKYFVDFNGRRIYSCCVECLPIIKNNPELAIQNLEVMQQYACTIAKAKKIEKALASVK